MLKLCPTCQHWCPTRGTHRVCSQCRRIARTREQLQARLTRPQRSVFYKLIGTGMSRQDAIRAAAVSP